MHTELRERHLSQDATLMQHRKSLLRAVMPIVRNSAEAEDVVQQAMLHAYEHLDQFEGKAKFSTWLARIAIYEALGRLRMRRRFDELTEKPGHGPDPEQEAAEAQRVDLVRSAIRKLPAPYRTVMVFRGLRELSTRETGERLSLSDEAVKTRFHRARAMLKRELTPLMGEQ